MKLEKSTSFEVYEGIAAIVGVRRPVEGKPLN